MSKKKTELKQDPKNARKHSEFNKELIQQSFDKLGAGRSGLADADGYMIAGNQSLESAELAGKKIKVIPTDGTEYIVLQRTDLKYNDKRRKELAIVDNSASDSSTFIEEVFEDEYFDEVDIEDLGVTFEEEIQDANETDYSDKNKEIDIDELSDEMKLTLNFESTIYWEVKKRLSEIGQTPEDAICKLLNIDNE